ncbi:hypothetical protein QIS99_29970 [Streptomyces sp. B-S-A8]|uniref:Secreted protein n=1 Tax=Streptomyces solicavernae TaxID=3043614 RepID=A0ABT6S123_9ACTN|nr:hypothetical protein [Streptomyces sp. B-S-A8]MDI3390387.1 hypothetical protein [Streptomyces sp. B-S-A8]
MKLTSRAGLSVLMTCLASAAAVAPAAAADSVPVPVPLEGLETALPVEVPDVRAGVPLLKPGAPVAAERGEGRLVGQDVLPQLPVHSALPETVLDVPVTDPLTQEQLAGVGVESVESPVEALSPGLGLNAPLTQPGEGPLGLPAADVPELALLTPTLQATPAAGTYLS